jgi:nicotinamide riboside kinase
LSNKIVITGPESSGKTTLSKSLAEQYQLPLVEEYARDYLTNLETDYTKEDVLSMAQEQLRLEEQQLELCICDTDLSVYAIWIKEKYNEEVDWINDHLKKSSQKIYLLCKPDIPWQQDELREHPREEDRERLFQEYVSLLKKYNLVFHIVGGNRDERQKKCQEIIDKLI